MTYATSVHFRSNSTAVLDFLYACIHIPKIWQGREQKKPKVSVPPVESTTFVHAMSLTLFVTGGISLSLELASC